MEDVVRSYEDSRIVYIDQENKGLTKSLNIGLHLAKGMYIARMDSDDLSESDRLMLQIQEITGNPDLDLVGADFAVMDESGRVIETKNLIRDDEYRLWRLQFHNNYGHGAVMFKKNAVLAKGGYNPALRYAQDYDLWSRLSLKNNTSIIGKTLYKYRHVLKGSQASVKHYDAQLAAAIMISNKNLMDCNPSLTNEMATDVRALYWKFEKSELCAAGLKLLPETLQGFFQKYGFSEVEKSRLSSRVLQDIQMEIEATPTLSHEEIRAFKGGLE